MRSRPQPSAPCATASCASATVPARLANTSMRSPLASRQSDARPRAPGRAAPRRCVKRRARGVELRPFAACDAHGARFGVEDHIGARAAPRAARDPAATSMGMPSVPARIATCEVGPPPASAMPPSFPVSRSINCDGVRSRASRMAAGRNRRRLRHRRRRSATTPGVRDRAGRRPARSAVHLRSLRARRRSRAARRARRSRRSCPPSIAARGGLDQVRVVQQLEMRGHDVAHGRRRGRGEFCQTRADRVARALEKRAFVSGASAGSADGNLRVVQIERRGLRPDPGSRPLPRRTPGSEFAGVTAASRGLRGAQRPRDCGSASRSARCRRWRAGSKPLMTSSSPPRTPRHISATALRALAARPRARISSS